MCSQVCVLWEGVCILYILCLGSVLSVWTKVESVLTNDGQKKGQHAKMQVRRKLSELFLDSDHDHVQGGKNEAGRREAYCGDPHTWVSHGPAGQGVRPGGGGGGGNHSLKSRRAGQSLKRLWL